MAHAKFSPSKLPRIIRCPGSVKLTEGIYQASSKYADEGTMLHNITEQALTLGIPKLDEDLSKGLNTEQVDAVNDCIDFTFWLKTRHDEECYEQLEANVSLAGFADDLNCPLLQDVYGTLDYSLSFPAARALYIADWKFGKGVEVYPDSEQLKAYGLAALKNRTVMSNFDKIVLCIGQPRLYMGETFKELETTPSELFSWASKELVPSLANSQSNNPKFSPSKKACMWCEAKMSCEHRLRAANEAAAEVFAAHAKLPGRVDIEELVKLHRKGKQLKDMLADIEVYLMNRIKKGEEVPGKKLVAGRSNRTWTSPEAFVRWAQEALDLTENDVTMPGKLMSPSQAEKKFGRKVAKTDDFLDLIHKPEGKPTLVDDTDKRPALEFQTAEDKFKQFSEES